MGLMEDKKFHYSKGPLAEKINRVFISNPRLEITTWLLPTPISLMFLTPMRPLRLSNVNTLWMEPIQLVTCLD